MTGEGGLLALDLARVFGAAWGKEVDRKPQVERVALPKEYERGLSILREYVVIKVRSHGIKVVVVEAVERFLGPKRTADTFFRLASYGAVAREAAYSHGAHVVEVPVQTWRAHFLMNGKLKGDDAHAAARQWCNRYQWPFLDDDNVAEACGIWMWGMCKFYPKWQPQRLL